MSLSSSDHTDVANMTFEEALRELEAIVKQLENIQKQLNLEESIAAYERGTILRRHCEAKLQEAEMKIEKLAIPERVNKNIIWDEVKENGSKGEDKEGVMSLIAKNLSEIKRLISKEAEYCSRCIEDIKIVAVSKTQPREKLVVALEAGHRIFGENRVQEVKRKWSGLREMYPGLELHMIGPLQTNKVKDAMRLFDGIETLDRPPLARALASEIRASGRSLRLFIQVNTGQEPQKAGVTPQNFESFLGLCRHELGLSIEGVMCIPPLDEDPVYHFSLLRNLAHAAGLSEVSMGMSGDFLVAVRCGATYVRLGTRIFGTRLAS